MKQLIFFLIFSLMSLGACVQNIGKKEADLAIDIQKTRMDSMRLAYQIYDPTNYGFKFKEAEITPCNEDMSNDLDSKIRLINKSDSTLVIDIYLVETCCINFEFDTNIRKENTLNLTYINTGKYACACKCCYGLTYTIEIAPEHEKFSKILYITLNENEKMLKTF